MPAIHARAAATTTAAILLNLWSMAPALGQERPAAPFDPPADIEYRRADVISEGVRLQAELFSPRSLSGQRLPTVIQAHGWGGLAAHLRNDAVDIARAGYLVINFDYRGWGQSDGRVVLEGDMPDTDDPGFTARVRELRGYIDPFEQTEDWFNVIHWAMAEPMADAERIGVRGSSYSGGHVVYVAAFEPRVKAVVSQVGATDIARGIPQMYEDAEEEATRRARGEIAYPEPFVREFNLTGLPLKTKGLRYSPNDVADQVRVPTLFIVAENEELYTNESQAVIAHQRINAPKDYVVIPDITHYGIYGDARDEAIRLAVEWFDQHLK